MRVSLRHIGMPRALRWTWYCMLLWSAPAFAGGWDFRPADSPFPVPASLCIDGGQDTIRAAQTGRLTRRARAAQQRGTVRSAEGAAADTSRSILDMIRALPRDSSARLTQFLYVRRDPPAIDGRYHRSSPMFLADPMAIRNLELLDSTRWVYHLRRTLGGVDLKTPIDVPLDQYAGLRLARAIRQNWETMAQAYQIEEEKKQGLGELFGKVTNIEIPVPKNPLFSIFGPNIIHLQINGGVDVHAAFRNTASDLYTASPLGQSRNEPDFNQQVQVNVKGEIGDKLKIDADWNTQRTFEYENQLKVRYQGYEDEIVQSIEAGNVSLSTSSAFISSSQALFGIKAGFQFGPLRLTTVASQKKGQIKELAVSGGARPTPFERRAPDYSRDHYFIDTSYISLYEDVFLKIPAQPDPTRQIRDIEVWVSRVGQRLPTDRDVIAYMDLQQVVSKMNDNVARAENLDRVPGEIEVGGFFRLDPGTDYVYNADAGIISMNRALQPDQAVAVAFEWTDLAGNVVDYGNFGSRTPLDSLKLILKLVRPKNLDPQMRTAWRMMLKNRYPLGGRGIKKDGFELHLEYEIYGQSPVRDVLDNVGLLEMFGLDRFTGTTSPQPDKVFDYFPGITVDEARGELIFPTVEPFRASTIKRFLLAKGFDQARAQAAADSFSFDAIYDTTYNGALNSQRNKYAIRGTITPATASSYNLGFNIVEGSVEVYVDGQRAVPNVDYNVDYITGQVVIKNQSFLVPGKNLQIKYEANDLFQLASKSLLGARGDFNLGKNATLGFTFMNLNQQSLSDKVRLGEEPISNTIMGVDGSTTLDLPFVTRALNWLPGIKTLAPSQIRFGGEAAYMSPDPNTRKSPIPEDGGKGIAYIDDFEGARVTTPLGVSYAGWKDASPPYFMANLDTYLPGLDGKIPTTDDLLNNGSILADTVKIQYKAKAAWFNVIPSDVAVFDIWGKRKSVARGQEAVTVLNFYFKPNVRGEFNYSMNLENRLFADPTKAWAGIQHVLGITSTNLLDQNINFIEFWVKVVSSDPGAKLNINLGYISEDVIPNKKLNTEDGLDGNPPNGLLNPAVEDLGLDMLSNDQERQTYKAFLDRYGPTHPEYIDDPSGDNWSRPPVGFERSGLTVDGAEQYLNVNGTDGNSGSEIGRLYPDTEDLNGNNVLDRTNAYFEYEIPLDTSDIRFKQYVVGGGEFGWYQVRIPLNQYTREIGDPTLTNVEGIRLWVTGAQNPLLFRMAEFNLVGNQWEELVKNDSTFKVSVVNYEDNPTYVSPPGVERQRDRTRPDENVYGNEQALNLIVHGLQDGQRKEAIKRYNLRPLDVFSYRKLKLFLHGELGDAIKGYRAFQYHDTSDYDALASLRIGSDSLNYYEYRTPIRPGWDPLNEAVVNFTELTAIKFERDSARAPSRRVPVRDGPPGSTYQVVGEPTLTNIRYISVGIENPANKGAAVLDGELWANEMRLIDVDDTPGWAYRFDSQLKLADVANMAFSYSQRDPNFHSLEDRFGTRNTNRSWNLSANIGLERFLPETWNGTSLGVSYSHTEAIAKPKYLPGTDILVDEAASRVAADTSANRETPDALRVRTQDLSVTDTYAAPSIRLNIPSGSWLVTETINRMTFGYSYNVSRRRSPTIEYSEAWGWNAQFSYNLQFGQNNYVAPFSWASDIFLLNSWKDLKLYFSPRQVAFGFSVSRAQSRDRARNQLVPNPVVRNLAANRNFSFGWQFFDGKLLGLGTDYQVNISSSLLHLETDRFGNQRSFSDILGDILLSDRLINFGVDQGYNQVISLNTRLTMPQVAGLDKVFTPNLRYSSQYNWINNIQAGPLGRSAGWSATLSSGLEINLKPISDAIWPPQPSVKTAPAPGDTAGAKKSGGTLKQLDLLTRVLLKIPIFDFGKVSVTFSQSNRAQNSGVRGGNGFANIFARVPFIQSSLPENGPSLFYQLGLASDPHGDVVLKTKSSFPFITGYTVPGLRAPNGNLTDIFSQSNTVSLRTSRPLWEGADLELSWRVSWSYNENRIIMTDSLGVPSERSHTVSGDVERSYLTLPPVLFFKLFRTSLEDVQKQYQTLKINKSDARPDEAKLSQAFEQGLEALPTLTRILGALAPRANWSIRWSGLEQLPLFSSVASRVSLDHAYSSSYRRRWRLSPQGGEVTESQSVMFGFAPLVGVNLTFKEIIKGNIGATFRYSTNTTYDLSPSSLNVVESGTQDISITGNYSRQGFEIPFFGLSLSNDLDMTFTYTLSKNSRRLYDFRENFKKDGTPMEGSSRTVMEPRIRYTLSARVTASLYYRYTKISPDAGGSRVPGSTINEGGLDVHVAIQ